MLLLLLHGGLGMRTMSLYMISWLAPGVEGSRLFLYMQLINKHQLKGDSTKGKFYISVGMLVLCVGTSSARKGHCTICVLSSSKSAGMKMILPALGAEIVACMHAWIALGLSILCYTNHLTASLCASRPFVHLIRQTA